MPANCDDRYFHDGEGRRLGHLGRQLDFTGADALGLVDEWLGIELVWRTSCPASIWTFPIETVSQSEGGFELVHQSIAVLRRWYIQADSDGRWSVTMSLSIDTTRAESRMEKPAAVAVAQ